MKERSRARERSNREKPTRDKQKRRSKNKGVKSQSRETQGDPFRIAKRSAKLHNKEVFERAIYTGANGLQLLLLWTPGTELVGQLGTCGCDVIMRCPLGS